MTRGPGDESNPEGFLTRIPLFAEVDRGALARLAAHLDPVVLTGPPSRRRPQDRRPLSSP